MEGADLDDETGRRVQNFLDMPSDVMAVLGGKREAEALHPPARPRGARRDDGSHAVVRAAPAVVEQLAQRLGRRVAERLAGRRQAGAVVKDGLGQGGPGHREDREEVR